MVELVITVLTSIYLSVTEGTLQISLSEENTLCIHVATRLQWFDITSLCQLEKQRSPAELYSS